MTSGGTYSDQWALKGHGTSHITTSVFVIFASESGVATTKVYTNEEQSPRI